MLSQEVKDALAEHYRGKDLYHPHKDPSQDTEAYMASGGPVMEQGPIEQMEQGPVDTMAQGPQDSLMQGNDDSAHAFGMADPGDIALRQSQPSPAQRFRPADLSRQPSMSQGPIDAIVQGKDTKNGPSPAIRDALASRPSPQMPTPSAPPSAPPAINPADLAYAKAAMMQDQPQTTGNPGSTGITGNPGKLAPDEMEQLIAAFSQKPSAGQSAMMGLAGLADAISTGVARSANPGFEKGIYGQQEQRRQDLINALRAKYELGYKGQMMNLDKQRLASETASQQKERELQKRQQDIEGGLRGATLDFQRNKEAREASQNEQQKQIDALKGAATSVPWYEKINPFASPQEGINNQLQSLGSMPRAGGAGGAASPTVTRTVKGKPAQFDPRTKQFVRWGV